MYILRDFKKHNDVCMNEIVNGTESRFPIPSKQIIPVIINQLINTNEQLLLSLLILINCNQLASI